MEVNYFTILYWFCHTSTSLHMSVFPSQSVSSVLLIIFLINQNIPTIVLVQSLNCERIPMNWSMPGFLVLHYHHNHVYCEILIFWIMSIIRCKAMQFSWNFSKVRLNKNVLELCCWWGLFPSSFLFFGGGGWFLFHFLKLKCSWCTILCKLQVYNIVIHNF